MQSKVIVLKAELKFWDFFTFSWNNLEQSITFSAMFYITWFWNSDGQTNYLFPSILDTAFSYD